MRHYSKLFRKAVGAMAFAFLALSLSACSATTSTSTRIQLGATITPPMGLVVFCRGLEDGCEPAAELVDGDNSASAGGQGDAKKHSDSEPEATNEAHTETTDQMARVEVGADMLAEITRVNQRVNNQMTWQTDFDIYGVEERWTMPLSLGLGSAGDCEDFALEKRRRLLELGVPPAALALAITYSESTGRHAVLVVRTAQGDYVLDNTTPWVLPWATTGYQWLNIQEGESLMQWRMVL